ncbi:condensation domain-containing protein [Plantactinospora sp. DSM 117369]
MQRNGPLSFGQLSIWRDVRTLPPARWAEANVSAVWPLPDGTAVAGVRRAMQRLVRRHPSLRTTYQLTDPDRPEQLVQPDGDLELDVVDLATQDVPAALAELGSGPFDLERGTGWRARVLTARGHAAYLVFVNHHIVADGGGQAVLQADLSAQLRTPAGNAVEEDTYSLVTMAEEQRSPTFAAKNEAALRNWRACLPPACSSAMGDPAPPDAETLQASLCCPGLATTAYDLARRADISPASVFLAAYAMAIRRATGLTSVPLRLMSSNRFSARWGRYVTSMNQWAPLQFDMPVEDDLPALARRLHHVAVRAYRLGMYDPEALARLRADRPELSRQAESAWAFNHITADRSLYVSGSDDPSDGEVRWESGFHRFGHRFYLRAFDDGTLRLRGRGTSRDLVAAILTGVRDVMVGPAPVR